MFGRAVERATKPERFIVGVPRVRSSRCRARWKLPRSAFGCPILPMRFESAELAKISINCCLVASVTRRQYACRIVRAHRRRLVGDRAGAQARPPHRRLLLSRTRPWHCRRQSRARSCHRPALCSRNTAPRPASIRAFVAQQCVTARTGRLRTLHDVVLSKSPQATIGILGLAYKENTHSVKNSPSLALIRQLGAWPLRVLRPGGAGFDGVAPCGDRRASRPRRSPGRGRSRDYDALAGIPNARLRLISHGDARTGRARSLSRARSLGRAWRPVSITERSASPETPC